MSNAEPPPARPQRHVCFLTGTRADFGKLKPLIVGAADAAGDPGDGGRDRHAPAREVRLHRDRGAAAGTGGADPGVRQPGRRRHDGPRARPHGRGAGGPDRRRPPRTCSSCTATASRRSPGAAAGALRNVAVAHVEGGELSGTIDGVLRHAVSKLSHLHLVANDEAERRVVQLGEDPDTVWAIGSPDIDVMLSDHLPPLDEVLAELRDPLRRLRRW